MQKRLSSTWPSDPAESPNSIVHITWAQMIEQGDPALDGPTSPTDFFFKNPLTAALSQG